MSAALIGLVTVIYLGVAVSEFANGRHGMGLCFIGYTVANVGLIMAIPK